MPRRPVSTREQPAMKTSEKSFYKRNASYFEVMSQRAVETIASKKLVVVHILYSTNTWIKSFLVVVLDSMAKR